MAEERLQKILAGGGLASRRAAERLITEGRVRLNGRIVTELGVKADPRKDRIEVDGKRVIQEPPVYYAVHKPRGFVTVDGISHGKAPPLQQVELPPGRHRIRITHERQPPLEFSVDLAPGEQMTVSHTFGKEAPKVTAGGLWRDLKRKFGFGP